METAFDHDPLEQARRGQQCSGGDQEDDPGVGDRDEHPRHERPEERAEALERRRRAVGGDQLFGSPGKRGQGCLESRPENRRGDSHDAGEREHDQLAAAEEVGRGRSTERGRARERDDDEEPLSPEPVAERRREGSDERGREHPDETGDPDRRSSAGVVGEVERRQIMSERAQRIGIDRAHLCEIERLEHRAFDRLERPFGKVIGPHRQQDRLWRARDRIVAVEAQPGDLLRGGQHLDPVVHHQPGYAGTRGGGPR